MARPYDSVVARWWCLALRRASYRALYQANTVRPYGCVSLEGTTCGPLRAPTTARRRFCGISAYTSVGSGRIARRECDVRAIASTNDCATPLLRH